MEAILSRYVDDYKSIPVDSYITLHRRLFPEADLSFLEGKRTIVVLALSYPKEKPRPKGPGYGMVSRYAHGRDYHLVFKERLEAIEQALKEEGVTAEGAVDINPVDERLAAFAAGMGYIGYNRYLIHPVYGTHLYLATLLIDKDVRFAPYERDTCGDCRRCIEACPTEALEENAFHVGRCLSHKTQAKAYYPPRELEAFHYVFGCDICADVCPKNEAISPVERDVFQSDEHAQLHLETLLSQSNKELMRRFKGYAFAWRGGLVLKRNALALLYRRGLLDEGTLEPLYEQYAHVPWFERTVRALFEEEESL